MTGLERISPELDFPQDIVDSLAGESLRDDCINTVDTYFKQSQIAVLKHELISNENISANLCEN